VAAPGLRHLSERITVIDSGTRPLHIVTGTRLVHEQGGKCIPGASPSWASVTPAALDLRPGQHATAVFTVDAPGSVHGRTGIDATFAGQVPAPGKSPVKGTVPVSGEIGSQLVLRLPGHPAQHPCTLAAPPPPPAPGMPLAAFALPAGGLLLAAALTAALVRFARHKGSRRAPGGRHHRARGNHGY
jgi:hypothetical protein